MRNRAVDTANWRVAKSVFVAKDTATAKAHATSPDGPTCYYYHQLFTKLKRSGRLELFKTRRDPALTREVTLQRLICDKLVVYGTPDSVADQLLAVPRRSRLLSGTLLAGKDPERIAELGCQSMILMAEKVLAAHQCRRRITLRRHRQGNSRHRHSLIVLPSGRQSSRPPEQHRPGGKTRRLGLLNVRGMARIGHPKMPRTVLSLADGPALALPAAPNWSLARNTACALAASAAIQGPHRSKHYWCTAAVSANANVSNSYPRVASAALEAGFGLMKTASSRARCIRSENQAGRDQARGRHHSRFCRQATVIMGEPGP